MITTQVDTRDLTSEPYFHRDLRIISAVGELVIDVATFGTLKGAFSAIKYQPSVIF